MQDFAGNTVRAADIEPIDGAPSEPADPGGPPAASERRTARLEDLRGRGDVRSLSLPMLDLALDRLPDHLGQRLTATWKRPVSAVAGPRAVGTFDEANAPDEALRLFGMFRSADGEDAGLIVFPADLVWQMLDCMLGGMGGGGLDRRRFSHLDRCLMRAAADHVLAALDEAFAPVGALSLQFVDWAEAVETIRPGSPGVAILRQSVRLALPQGEGAFDILLPLSLFGQRLEALAAPHPGERLGHDTIWRQRLAEEVQRATVTVEAVLYEGTALIGDIRALKPGDFYSFGLPPNAALRLRSGGRDLGLAQLGRSGSLAAVRLETSVETRAELAPCR